MTKYNPYQSPRYLDDLQRTLDLFLVILQVD